jgi:hypothetical protein
VIGIVVTIWLVTSTLGDTLLLGLMGINEHGWEALIDSAKNANEGSRSLTAEKQALDGYSTSNAGGRLNQFGARRY